jgi:anti-sigma B factor antagonist
MSHEPTTFILRLPELTGPLLALEPVVVGPVTVLRATGDLDLSTAPLLDELVGSLLAEHAPLLLQLDLSGLEFLDANGISALLRVRAAVAAGGGHLTLRRPSGRTRLILSIAQVAEAFQIEDDPA